jgi:teichuronic acid biosynthesis protein TuaE
MRKLVIDELGNLTKFSYFILAAFAVSALIGSGIRYSNIYLFHILLIPAGVITLATAFYQKRISRLLKSTSIIWLLLIWYMVSYSWTLDREFGRSYLIIITLMFITILVTQNFVISTGKINKIIKYFYYVWIVQYILGFLEIHTSFRYPISNVSKYNKLFGIDFYDKFLIHSNTEWVRSTGFSWGTNDFSVFISLGMPFFLFYPMKKVLRILGVGLIFYLIDYNASRMCMIALSVMLLMKFIFSYKEIKVLFNRYKLLYIASFIGLLFSIYLLKPLVVKHVDRVINNVKVERGIIEGTRPVIENESVRLRTRWFINTADFWWKEKPLIGLGIGSAGSKNIHSERTTIHFFLLEILADVGFIGFMFFLIGYLFLLIKLFYISIQDTSKQFSAIGKILFTNLLAFLILGIALSSIIYFLPFYLLIGLALGVITLFEQQTK